MIRPPAVFLITLCGVAALTGCNSTKETLGLSRRAPDAFDVVLRAPLELPPDYALRPPVPGAPRPQDETPTDQAERALLGQTTPSKGGASRVENLLLRKTDADQAPQDIRAVINSETAADADTKTGTVQDLLGITPEHDPQIIDARAEKKRLDREKSVEKKK